MEKRKSNLKVGNTLDDLHPLILQIDAYLHYEPQEDTFFYHGRCLKCQADVQKSVLKTSFLLCL